MISDFQWNAFLAYARARLQEEPEVFALADDVVEACSFPRPYWDSLEARWRKEPPGDFDYEGQAPSRSFETTSAPYEPTIVRLWRRGEGQTSAGKS